MTKEELERKSETEGLTAEEVTEYQRLVKPMRHVYGKYGTIKKKYLEEHDWVKTAALGKDLPEYLHAIDRAADDLYETMYMKVLRIAGAAASFVLAGLLIAGTFIMNAIGALICIIEK